MEVIERKRSRGGFLNLFDWPGKSRKKLFSSSSSGLSDESKQTKQNAQSLSKSELSLLEVDEVGKNLSYNLRSDSSCCPSSATSDDGQGTRAPSVVARLMGLESLPVPNVQEPRFNPDLDPFFFRPASRRSKWDAYDNLGYVDLRSDYDDIALDYLDSTRNKGRNRPIERFQSETFPSRLAKPICITNNRLLSPIRSHEFVPSRTPIYVMEAASRIIEPSPRIVARTRFSPSNSPSSVPMRIQDLRDKLEAAQKGSSRQSSNDICNKNPSGKNNEKRISTAPTTSSTRKLLGKSSFDGLKGKMKPSDVSAQAKANDIHKQESSTPLNVNRSSAGQKEKAEAKRIIKSQNDLSTGKTMPKQNNQKQSCRNNQPAMTSASNNKCSKVPKKVANKSLVESGSTPKQSGTTTTTQKNSSISLARKKNFPQNRIQRNGMQESGISNDSKIKKGENLIKCNITIDGGFNTGKDDQKKEMDVISFTFSSPIKGLSSESRSSTQRVDQDADSAVSFSMIGDDSLNVLLEQKLRELTSKIESSSCSLTLEESSGSIPKGGVKELVSSLSEYEDLTQSGPDQVLSENELVSDCTSFFNNRKFQMIQEEEQEVSSISTVREADDLRNSCRHTAEYGMIKSSSDQELTRVSSKESHQTLDETKLSESVVTPTYSEAEETNDWELEYISEILSSGQLMVKEFALGMATDILPASLFNEMEGEGDQTAKTERKVLFDFVNSCLGLKCEQMFTGSCRELLGKQGLLFEQRDWLAKELKREIHGLKKMQELMMDELLDKDMSSLEGKWLDFERETYEEGIDIEAEIVSTLVDDLVYDHVISVQRRTLKIKDNSE